jgi:CBS-domain-containing membrane protein
MNTIPILLSSVLALVCAFMTDHYLVRRRYPSALACTLLGAAHLGIALFLLFG